MKHKILITGGAKRIGEALACFFADQGWSVIIHAHTSIKDAKDLAESLRNKGLEVLAVQADLSDAEQTKELIPSIVKDFGNIDVLINNASTFDIENDTIENLDDELWSQHMNVNALAPLLLSQAFAKQLLPGIEGNIINLLDQRVLNLTPNFLTYTVSKSALWTLTRTLAMALAPSIRVNGIGPGPTYPDIYLSDEKFRKQVDRLPLKRKTDVQDIARTALNIINTPSITGQMIALDGGQHLGWANTIKKVIE